MVVFTFGFEKSIKIRHLLGEVHSLKPECYDSTSSLATEKNTDRIYSFCQNMTSFTPFCNRVNEIYTAMPFFWEDPNNE